MSLQMSDKMGVWARCRHFSFILDGQRIVSTGTNTRKTHPANLLYGYVNRNMEPISSMVGTHSEMRAVLSFGIDNCKGLTLVNVRVDRNRKISMSKPCSGCMDMIISAGFQKVLYTDEGGDFRRMEL